MATGLVADIAVFQFRIENKGSCGKKEGKMELRIMAYRDFMNDLVRATVGAACAL